MAISPSTPEQDLARKYCHDNASKVQAVMFAETRVGSGNVLPKWQTFATKTDLLDAIISAEARFPLSLSRESPLGRKAIHTRDRLREAFTSLYAYLSSRPIYSLREHRVADRKRMMYELESVTAHRVVQELKLVPRNDIDAHYATAHRVLRIQFEMMISVGSSARAADEASLQTLRGLSGDVYEALEIDLSYIGLMAWFSETEPPWQQVVLNNPLDTSDEEWRQRLAATPHTQLSPPAYRDTAARFCRDALRAVTSFAFHETTERVHRHPDQLLGVSEPEYVAAWQLVPTTERLEQELRARIPPYDSRSVLSSHDLTRNKKARYTVEVLVDAFTITADDFRPSEDPYYGLLAISISSAEGLWRTYADCRLQGLSELAAEQSDMQMLQSTAAKYVTQMYETGVALGLPLVWIDERLFAWAARVADELGDITLVPMRWIVSCFLGTVPSDKVVIL